MNLSLRLTEVKNTVIPCDFGADVGCDHGFVAISLVKEGKVGKMLAMDVNKGPLEGCLENIKAEGAEDRISVRLSDGLKAVSEDEALDTVIIAGMGGALTTRILTDGKDKLKSIKQLVLSPQSETFLVRKWLRENGYNIQKESMVLDAGKYYFIMDVRPGNPPALSDELTEIYDLYSGYLIRTGNTLLREYLQKGLSNNKGYLESIEPSKQGTLKRKIEIMEKTLELMPEP